MAGPPATVATRSVAPAPVDAEAAAPLTPAQEQVAVLLAARGRVGEVARLVGIDRATVWRYAKLPAVRERIEAAEADRWQAGREAGSSLGGFMLALASRAAMRIEDPARQVAACLAIVRTIGNAGLLDAAAVIDGEAARVAEAEAILTAAERERIEDAAVADAGRKFRDAERRVEALAAKLPH